MISLEASLALYAQQLRPLAPERSALADALGHVLAEDVASRVDLPMFTQSAVDGYALHSADAQATLRVIGEIAAGAAPTIELPRGCAMRIFTGGALPIGADTCARQEIVERIGDDIRLQKSLAAGADTRFRGEEIRKGETLARSGQRIHSGLIASMAMAGVASVLVRPRPRIALIVTGNEVAGDAPRSGEIHDANGPLITSWLRERGYPLTSVKHVRDEPALLRGALAEALAEADLVLTTGGVSVGDHDHVPAVAKALGVREVFWNVAQKPGKPLWFGVHADRKAMLGFPGNPAAVFVALHVHARRVLGLLEGESAESPGWQIAPLVGAIRADARRDQLVRVAVSHGSDGAPRLRMLPRQDSHMLSNLAEATGLAWIATEHRADDFVRWIPL